MRIGDFIALWSASPFGDTAALPWTVTLAATQLIEAALADLGPGYRRCGDVAIHQTARVEDAGAIKGPAIIGPRSFVSRAALLRGGVYLDADCSVGPSAELKTVFMFARAKVAHLNFIGDSIIGAEVNFEAGAVVANHRNELDDKRIRILVGLAVVDTGVEKFGALVGDGCTIGANAVIAPGAVLKPGTHVPRLGLVDQQPSRDARPT